MAGVCGNHGNRGSIMFYLGDALRCETYTTRRETYTTRRETYGNPATRCEIAL